MNPLGSTHMRSAVDISPGSLNTRPKAKEPRREDRKDLNGRDEVLRQVDTLSTIEQPSRHSLAEHHDSRAWGRCLH